jgi:NitT/TauT family transport system ATP-binding protein
MARLAPGLRQKGPARVQIHLDNVGKQFKTTGEVLRAIDLTIAKGEFVSLLGPSGCGKSTLLRLIAGLDTPTTGTIEVHDVNVPNVRRAMGVVFQDARLLPWRSAADNVTLPLELLHWPREERAARVARVLAMVGLERYADTYPAELSGGMKMRVSLARSLVTAPEMMLLDEPFGALDEITRQGLNDELLKLWQQDRWTALFVTHNIVEAVFLSQRVVVMGRHPGVIRHISEVPFPYPRPAALRTAPEFGRLVGELMGHLERVSQ